jgi:hypothetical protein
VANRRDPDLLEVVSGQAWQDPGIDVVVTERLRVPAQAQPVQPRIDVHALPSAEDLGLARSPHSRREQQEALR